ncbi:MAG: hypothetical protein EOO90_22035 [Pedobacter sp.]|nr:MAG: hypothetical protein EOO90_22035 [Pedobacter sp.]
MSDFIATDAKVKNSHTGLSCKIYSRAELSNTNMGDYVTIGNDTIIQESSLAGNISINRRNFIHRSKIGHFCYTGIGTSLRSVDIGNFCSISWGVSVGGGNHPHDKVTTSTLSRFHFLDQGYRGELSANALQDTYKAQQSCKIGNDVLISSNVIILRDVVIGNGAIIGAGAVVTKDVEPYSIVAGVPSKKLKMRFEDNIIAELEEIQWWNWPLSLIRENLKLIYSSKVDAEVILKLKEISNTIL